MTESEMMQLAKDGKPVCIGLWLASTCKQGAKPDPKNASRLRKWGMTLHTVLVGDQAGEIMEFCEDPEKFDAAAENAKPRMFKKLDPIVLVDFEKSTKDFKLGGAVEKIFPFDGKVSKV